jgi:tyrosyl-tRNA synthetase
MPLLEGIDGVQKMSKSLGNYIGINEAPEEIFGKIMSVSDTLMWRYYELLTDAGLDQIQSLRAQVESGKLHPMEAKKDLGSELVARFHGRAKAESARHYFESKFQKKTAPTEIRQQFSVPEPIWICRLMVDLKFAKSTSEARRLLAQNAVKVDREVVTDANFQFDGTRHKIIEVGKNRIAKSVAAS